MGAPYVWRGKGLELWDAAGAKSHHWGEPVFDCSGLVTTAIHEAGGPDWRLTHSAQTLFDALARAETPRTPRGTFGELKFYGASPKSVTHVAIDLGHGLVLEAAGGDATTTTPAIARARGARVRVVFDGRHDCVGAGPLSAIPEF